MLLRVKTLQCAQKFLTFINQALFKYFYWPIGFVSDYFVLFHQFVNFKVLNLPICHRKTRMLYKMNIIKVQTQVHQAIFKLYY